MVTVEPPKPEESKPETKVVGAAEPQWATTSFGSGFIIDPSGFVATNKHVIDKATSIFVVTAEGIRYQATIVGMPAKADIALLKIDAGRNLPFLSFADSDKVRVGDTVIAIGSQFGFDNSVTAGIISGVNRDIMESPFDDYFQTDAATNHGNSGGPLLNLAGEVIGMNSVIITPDKGWVGLTFAVPSNNLHFVFDRLMKTGEIRAGMLPIDTQQVSWMLEQALGTPGLEGALVSEVKDKDDMMLGGKIKPGDVILSFNGQKIRDPRDLARKTAKAPIGSDAVLELFRGGQREVVHVTVQAWPEVKPASGSDPRKLGLELTAGRRENGEPVVTVASVDPKGTAADSGIQKGDLIIEVQQTPVSEPDQASRLLGAQSPETQRFAAVLVERGKKRMWIPVAVPD
ncbi:MAG: trypsin-like peptidase domain-containing protein [Rhodopila sp.]|nr:trypsin-like peptidase domain-containing protein [Rhodopila sp.]